MKRHVKRKLILFIFILTFAFTWAQENNTKVEGKKTTHSYRIPETNASLKVDGELDDKVWENALEIELKYEVEPGENVAASVRTVCLLTYAKSHLYVAFKAYDPKPEMLRAYLNDRDSGQSDDWVGLVLDTFNDKRRAFDFRSNPLGIQSDGVQVDSNTDFSWDAIWNSAGKIYKWGYAVEMSIPFSALRFQRSEEKQEWGFDAVRYYPRTHKYYMGTFPRDRSNNCYLCQTIKIVGFKGVRPGRNIELTPTLTAVRTDERTDFPNGEFEKANSDIAAGITASWGISHNMTVNATVNPDFNQVEADALQLDINQPFALYYSEKRSFFTEGADFFKPRMTDFLSTTLNVIYTRSIRDPSWGVKLTGKGGNNTYGAFVVRDEITNLIFPGSRGSTSTSLAQANTSSVFRYRRDIGTKYTLGILATDREGEDYFNRLVGIDGDMRFTNKDRIQFQLLGSGTRYPSDVAAAFQQEDKTITGMVVDLNYRHNTRTLDYWARFQSFGRDFRADLGFIPQVDYRRYRVGGSYTWNAKPGSWYSNLSLFSEVDISEDLEGNLISGGAYVWSNYYGPLQTNLTVILGKARQQYYGIEFDQYAVDIMGGIQPISNLAFSFYGAFGDHIDYDNVQKAKRTLLNPGITCNMGRHVRLDLSLTYERLNVEAGRLYTATVADTSLLYQLNRRIFLRSIIQYVDYNYNVENYTFELEPRFKHLFTQFLFSYKLNPRTVLFLGYSDNYQGNQAYRLKQSDRTFFAKIGYALQL